MDYATIERTQNMTGPLRTLASVLCVAALYFCVGKLGLSLAFLHANASAVWPPSGIALAVLLLWGYRIWPGIFLGAFLVNITTQGSVATTLGIAAGNTLEALSGAWLVNHFANGLRAFERARNIFKFALATALSTVVSATFGVTSLTLGGFAQWEQYPVIWLTWWLGDTVGDLLVAPLVVIWVTQPYPRLKTTRVVEAAGLLLALILVGRIVFMGEIPSGMEYTAILPLLWATFRFGQRGGVTSAFVVSGLALLGTLKGAGPFATRDPNESLLLLQAFVGTISMASLVLAAVISERKRAEERLQVQDSVSRILAESPALKEAAPKIVQVLCEKAGWEVGAIWNVDEPANQLACVEVWHPPGIKVPEFEAATRQMRFARGIGLPGRVWSSGKPAWIADVTRDSNFPRAPVATKEDLHAAFGFPIKLGNQIVGVIECFSREVREPDDHFLQMAGDIGGQLGQFIERRRGEDLLRVKESQLNTVTNIIPVLLTQCSRELQYKFVNRAYADMLGLSPEQVIGKSIEEIMGTEGLETIRPYVDTVLQGQPVEYEAEIPLQRIGSPFLRVAYMPDRDEQGNVVGWIASITDISDRKQAEETRARLAAIVDSSEDAIISKNLDGIITSYNAGAERLFGYTAQEMIGQPVTRIIPIDRHEEETNILARVRRGERVQQYETVRIRRDGAPINVSLTISSIRDPKGNIIGASKIARNITGRKRAEEALLKARDDLVQANVQLEKRVQERTLELEQAHTALVREIEEEKKLEEQLRQSQKMESLGTLAGGIAHEFNNILNIISGCAQLISRHSSNAEIIADNLKNIHQSIKRGASVVRELLTLARKSEAYLTSTDANSVVAELVKLLKQTFPKDIEISLDLDPHLPSVMADPGQVTQALLNLSLNARDAMATGGWLVISTKLIDGRELQKSHAGATESQYVAIEVSDTGVGMDDSIQKRIFEPFFTTKGVGEGTGLGLAIVYGIMTNHKGFIDMDSKPGRGATFRLYFPLVPPQDQPVFDEMAITDAADRRHANGRGTILLVEDEETIARLLRDMLLQRGYKVLVASNGEEAIDLHLRHKQEIDVVVLDIGLPKMKGWDVLLKMKEENPGVKVLVATGYLEPELKSRIHGAGVKDFVQKPYTLEAMVAKLQALIERS